GREPLLLDCACRLLYLLCLPSDQRPWGKAGNEALPGLDAESGRERPAPGVARRAEALSARLPAARGGGEEGAPGSCHLEQADLSGSTATRPQHSGGPQGGPPTGVGALRERGRGRPHFHRPSSRAADPRPGGQPDSALPAARGRLALLRARREPSPTFSGLHLVLPRRPRPGTGAFEPGGR